MTMHSWFQTSPKFPLHLNPPVFDAALKLRFASSCREALARAALAGDIGEPNRAWGKSERGRKFTAKLALGPMCSAWLKLEDIFQNLPAVGRLLALFWLGNPQHVMLCSCQFNSASRTWMGQHH